MAEIPSLTSQAQQLGQSVDRWGVVVNTLIALTAIVGVLFFLATIRQFTLSKRLRVAQESLLQAKDRELQSDLRAKDVEIGKAKERHPKLTAQQGKLMNALKV